MRAPAGVDHIVLAPADRRRAVLEVIHAAQRRLLLSIFRCDDRSVIEALAATCRRNVRVEAVLTRHAKDPKTSLRLLRLLLEQIGVSVWRYADPLTKYHCKYIVADEGSALIGSLNFTRKCFGKTADFLVVTRDRAIVRGLTALFEADCGSSVAPPRGEFPARLIVGPDHARQQMTALLAQARHSIRIIDSKLTDEAIVALLEARARAGVDVQILAGKRVAGLLSHGKLVMLDGRKAIVGSMALSATNLDARREVAVVVEEPPAVAELVHFFDAALRFDRPRPVLVRESIA